MFSKIFKFLLILFYSLNKIGLKNFVKFYDNKSNNIVYFSLISGSISNEGLMWEFAYINALINQKKDFKVAFSLKDLVNKNIFWAPTKASLKNKDSNNYSFDLHKMCLDAESKNVIYPSSVEVEYWENKTFMYKRFSETGIKHPKTIVCKIKNGIPQDLDFPILLKGEHSSSSEDIYKVDSYEHLKHILDTTDYCKKFDHYIFQELIEMRRDLRVTMVEDKVVLAYWRINPDEDWKPTASNYGSIIKFDSYPAQWDSYFKNALKVLGLRMGAFDFVWENDDLSQEPIALEVSPRFSPNPVWNPLNTTYGNWKKKIFIKDSFTKKQLELIFKINSEYVNTLKIK